MDNLNILVEAKREYIEQLCILMCPVMIDFFDEMYNEANKISNGRKVLIMFQKLLQEVPKWSDAMEKENANNIANRCSWFKDLVAAVFVSSVKILSAVRLSKDTKKMSVKLPSNEVFIHSCYNNIAKDLYNNPYIFTQNQSEHERNDKLYERFSRCVENTVKELIPVQDILQTYMTVQDNAIVEPQDVDLTEDNVEEYEAPLEDAPTEDAPLEDAPTEDAPTEDAPLEDAPLEDAPTEDAPLGDAPLGDAPTEDAPTGGAPTGGAPPTLEGEFRTIKTLSESEDLFSDAPESRR